MHILTLESRVELGPKDIIEPGEYIVDDVSGAQLLVMAGGGKMEKLGELAEHAYRFELTTPSPEESVLFMRAGGFGDLLLLTPVLREHKRRWPNARIGVCTMGHYAPVLEGLTYIDEIVPYPATTERLYQFDRWVFFENAIERNPRAREVHMTDLFAEIAGVEFATRASRKPDYRVKATEAIAASAQFPRSLKRRACIQVGASALARRYPLAHIADVSRTLIQRGWEVFLLGQPGELPPVTRKVQDLHDLTRSGLTFRQSCAVLSQCDVVIAPDSALLHVAGALGVPAVGLYGPFPWQLRTAYCPTTVALTGNKGGDMCLCFHHVNMSKQDHFPAACPSKEKGVCGVLLDIKPERVVAKAESVARSS